MPSPSVRTLPLLLVSVLAAGTGAVTTTSSAAATTAPADEEIVAPLQVDEADTSAPVTTTAPAPAWWAGSRRDWAVSAVDPGPAASGVDSYDVRYRSGPAGGALGDFATPSGWSGTRSQVFTLDLSHGTQYCVSARARDVAGNVGAWSAESCTTADRVPPRLAVLSTPPAWSVDRVMSLAYAWSDWPSRVASYRMHYRVAPIGGPFGEFTVTPPRVARAWSTSMPPGSQYCVHVSARDHAGGSMTTPEPRCSSAALDERSMAAAGSTRTVASSVHYGGSVRTLLAAGSSVSYDDVYAGRVGVVLSTCPTCGVVEVHHAGTRLGQLSGRSATTEHRVLRWLPASYTRNGKLEIRTVDGRPVHVDAVVVQKDY